MNRRVDFAVDEYYHLYNRGTEKRKIFLGSADHNRFIVLLHLANNTEIVHISNLIDQGRSLMGLLEIQIPERLVALGAYCLMPNHFHLLVREKTENGISIFMKKLLTGYSMYFNKKYERSGNLFQGRFKASHVDNDSYLKHLYAYIHLNPLKLIVTDWRKRRIDVWQAKKFLDTYHYSSYPEYCLEENRPTRVLLDKDTFPEYFQTKQEHLKNLFSWLQDDESDIKVGP